MPERMDLGIQIISGQSEKGETTWKNPDVNEDIILKWILNHSFSKKEFPIINLY
jgi:hypothetical protein